MADLEKTRKNLENRGFRAHVFATGAEAADYLAQTLHNTCIGIGGSVTIDEIGAYDRLSADNDVIWRWKKPTPDSRERGAAAETFLCSANGVSETGEIVNIDGAGNRVASTLYGHQKVYLIAGRNKLAADYDGALWRARNVAAPKNAQRLNRKTPCAIKGDRCYDCKSPDRICCGLVVLWRPMMGQDIEIILVDEDLGC